MSASVLTCRGMASFQPRADELESSLASSCDATGHAPQKARRPSVEAALVVDFGLVLVRSRAQVLGDDFVQVSAEGGSSVC